MLGYPYKAMRRRMDMSHREDRTVGEKFIPLAKQSKKKRRAYYAAQRGDWGGISPVTRVCPSGKLYDRAKNRRISETD